MSRPASSDSEVKGPGPAPTQGSEPVSRLPVIVKAPAEPAPPSLAALYRAHAAAVARWASRLGGPTVDAEDVVHEVFMVAQRRLAEFRGDAKPTTWLYRITALTVRAHRRKARLRALLRRDVAAERGRAGPGSFQLTPVENLVERQRAELVYRALDALGEKYRSLFVLYELEGLSGEEIASLTGVKLATVWVRLHRARARFVERIKALHAREESRP
jgi:RNA polymerase sigma-70 factor (ECF subfamily)